MGALLAPRVHASVSHILLGPERPLIDTGPLWISVGFFQRFLLRTCGKCMYAHKRQEDIAHGDGVLSVLSQSAWDVASGKRSAHRGTCINHSREMGCGQNADGPQ
jgi:hypothetical protein